jgi:regulator of sigma E protease
VNAGTLIKHTFWRSYSCVKMVYDSIAGMFTQRYTIDAVSGPVGITGVITQAAKDSWLSLLHLLILISINLGVMNLLPLPALDGGHLLIYVIEAIRRKPLKPEVEGMINFVGLVLLLGLALLITVKDVIAL